MSHPPDIPRPVPYVLAQQMGELLVRIEKLERRVSYQGQAIKRLVNENAALNAKLSRMKQPTRVRSTAPSPRPVAETPAETPRPSHDGPDFTGSLRELRAVSRQAN